VSERYVSIARRKASARPTVRSDFMISKVEVVRRMAAYESTAQCDTSSARAPA